MSGNEHAVLEDLDRVGEHVNVEDATARRIGDAVEIATDAHHALVRDAPFELQDCPVWGKRQRLERRLLLGEDFIDDALRGGMHTWIGDRVEPVPQLRIEVVEVAKRSAKEEVLANVAERTLDLALGLGSIGPTGARLEAIVSRQVEKGTVVDDEAVRIFTDDRGLHAVVENFARCAADRFQRCDVAALDRLHVLVHDEAAPDQARVAKHQGEQPDNSLDAGLIGELDLEAGEIDLGLLAGRGLEPYFE